MEARNTQPTFHIAKLPSRSLAFHNAIHLSAAHQVKSKSFFAKFILPGSELTIYHPIIFDRSISNRDEMQLSSILRDNLHFKEGDAIQLEIVEKDSLLASSVQAVVINIRFLKASVSSKQLKMSEIKKQFLEHFANYPLCVGQDLALQFGGVTLTLSVEKIEGSISACHYLQPDTQLMINVSPFTDGFAIESDIANDVILRDRLFSPPQPKPILDFNLKGIGGHKQQLERLILQVFYSRIIPPEMAVAYGVKHVKGVLLYGPPGTGKTHIARSVAAIFPKTKVKVINGPELKSKYVGESPENVRNIFFEAKAEWQEKGKDSDVYVYIFDEIDSLAPIRGGQTGTHAEDDIVAQLLTELDGVDSPENIIILATTNRKELIDPALLRPGRLEEHIEIALPDEIGRWEILSIKTASMTAENLLDPKIDLKSLAKETKNYTAAELEQLVKRAVHFALENNLEAVDGGSLQFKKDILQKSQLARVTPEHFHRSFEEISPAFGVDKTCQQFAENFIIYNDDLQKLVDRFLLLLSKVEKNKKMTGFQMLISGESGTGKTSLAMFLAKLSGVNYVRTITPEKLLSLTTAKQLSLFDEELENAKRVPFSLIVLDELEGLLSADADLTNYSNLLRLRMESFLKALAISKNKCIVIATTQNLAFIERMHLSGLFNEQTLVGKVALSPLSSPACFKTLSDICDFLGYKILPSTHSQHDEREISLPIRDLVYEIKKFCADENHHDYLDIDAFYQSKANTCLRHSSR